MDHVDTITLAKAYGLNINDSDLRDRLEGVNKIEDIQITLAQLSELSYGTFSDFRRIQFAVIDCMTKAGKFVDMLELGGNLKAVQRGIVMDEFGQFLGRQINRSGKLPPRLDDKFDTFMAKVGAAVLRYSQGGEVEFRDHLTSRLSERN